MKHTILAAFLCVYAVIYRIPALGMEQEKQQVLCLFQKNKWSEFCAALDKKPELIKLQDTLGRSLLIWAVLQYRHIKNLDAIEWLIARCPDLLTLPDSSGALPFHKAAREGHEAVCRTLLVYPRYSSSKIPPNYYEPVVTTLLIYKHYKDTNSTLCKVPRRVLLSLILQPIYKEYWDMCIALHKHQVKNMLSASGIKGSKESNASKTAERFGHKELAVVLQPAHAAQWDSQIEKAYEHIKN